MIVNNSIGVAYPTSAQKWRKPLGKHFRKSCTSPAGVHPYRQSNKSEPSVISHPTPLSRCGDLQNQGLGPVTTCNDGALLLAMIMAPFFTVGVLPALILVVGFFIPAVVFLGILAFMGGYLSESLLNR